MRRERVHGFIEGLVKGKRAKGKRSIEKGFEAWEGRLIEGLVKGERAKGKEEHRERD